MYKIRTADLYLSNSSGKDYFYFTNGKSSSYGQTTLNHPKSFYRSRGQWGIQRLKKTCFKVPKEFL